nr:uncharacterized protein LOC118878762 [Drosophila suzukii]
MDFGLVHLQVSLLVDFVPYVRLADPYLVLLQVSSTPSTTETPLHFDALFPKFVYRVRRIAASHGCSHSRSLLAVAHVEEARASFRIPSGGHGTDPSEPCAAGPKFPLWTGVHVPSTTPSLCPIRERGSCAELHSTDIDIAGTPDGTRSRPRNGHRPRRRMSGEPAVHSDVAVSVAGSRVGV